MSCAGAGAGAGAAPAGAAVSCGVAGRDCDVLIIGAGTDGGLLVKLIAAAAAAAP
jgi:hypothetical protein